MEKSILSCSPMATKADKRWPYQQYYLGDEDQKRRKNGHGENHWSGAESLEWYTGKFVRDTMHGEGEYRWRYKGLEGSFVSYEGSFYGNRMHGYGVMSYPDGRVYNGILYNNVRWGPGIESHAHLQEDVGLWRGNQLVRLAWRPPTPSVTLDLNISPNANNYVEPYRTLLTTRVQTIGEVNSAIDLLKQSGATPMMALDKWTKLYPKNCTDFSSHVCYNEIFDLEYYRKKTYYDLEEVATMPDPKEVPEDDFPNTRTYYAWNNNKMLISMMKHCFKHEDQRHRSGIDLTSILTGLRSRYKQPGSHELDCRTLIMASYLGYITKVAQLVNEDNVHPDVADYLGNTALMYAACGDHGDIVHFLVAAGANVNSFNDSCCTPLGVALMKFACGRKDIAPRGMVQAFEPPAGVPSHLSATYLKEKPSEWYITRNVIVQDDSKTAHKKPSKANMGKSQNPKSSLSLITTGTSASKVELDDKLSENFRNISAEFLIKVTSLFSESGEVNRIDNFFDVIDMAKAMGAKVEEKKCREKNSPKKTKKNKTVAENTKNTKDILSPSSEKETNSLSSADRDKMDKLSQNMSTIVQLLKDGADPRLVRCPLPALRIATASGSSDLVQHLVKYGADINEVYPEALNYTCLDMAISQPLTFETLELIRAILESGARTDHRLDYQTVTSDPNLPYVQGPTLLHVVLAKYTDEAGENIRRQLLELLLEYNCNALAQFRGCSALDVAMMEKMDLFDIFIKSPKIDLNAAINDSNQTILVKMFSLDFFKTIPLSQCLATLTNLLLYGADPLLECQEADQKYTNVFAFAMKNIGGMRVNPNDEGVTKDVKDQQTKAKSKRKPPAKDKIVTTKPLLLLDDYMQALDLVTECVRILHVRWIQAKLLRELIEAVEKFEHRRWNMILPEYKNKKACGIWLTYPRAFEIWEIFIAVRKKKITDRRVLKHILCIVHFNYNRSKTTFKWPLTAEEKDLIDNEVACFLNEKKMPIVMTEQHYVTPELAVGTERKFQVCFECALPFEEKKIQCIFCKQVSFCSLECMKRSVKEERAGCHPCRDKLKGKYFPTDDNSSVLSALPN